MRAGDDRRATPAHAPAAAAAAQDELEAGTSAPILRDAAPLIELLARNAADGADEAGTDGLCSPRHLTHLAPSFLELNDIL